MKVVESSRLRMEGPRKCIVCGLAREARSLTGSIQRKELPHAL